jgi:hypothetical protein
MYHSIKEIEKSLVMYLEFYQKADSKQKRQSNFVVYKNKFNGTKKTLLFILLFFLQCWGMNSGPHECLRGIPLPL